MADERFTAIPTAEEYALFREAYSETYPVRPLLNAIDAKDAELTRLQEVYRREREAHEANLKEQQKCEAEIARLRSELARVVIANAEVAKLNAEQAETIERLRGALEKAKIRFEHIAGKTSCALDDPVAHAHGWLEDHAHLFTAEPKPLPTESAKGATVTELIPTPPGSRD